jgi:tripartite-type tricarboxylate transporter receptor subunit TctC
MRQRLSVYVRALAIVTLLGWGGIADADDTYPNRPIHLIVPYGAGGASDVMARQFSQKLSERIGQPVVVENQAAAAGTVAYTAVARSAPDGYTIGYGTSSLAVNAVLKAKPAYDPIAEFQPVSAFLTVQNVLVVPQVLPARTVGELVQLAKAKPAELNYVSLGPGSTPHLSAELFRAAAGINIQQISYKQTTQAYTDLIESRVQLWIASMPSALVHIKSGKLRALAVAGSNRSPALPEVPTLVEVGIPAESLFWQGIFVPAGTPMPIVQRLNAATRAIVADPAMQAWFLNLGAELGASTPEQLGAAVRAEMQKWTKIANDIGIERN